MSHPLCFLLIIATHDQLPTIARTSDIDLGLSIDLALIIHERPHDPLELKFIRESMTEFDFPNFLQWVPDGTRVGLVLNMPNDEFAHEWPAFQGQLPGRFEWSVALNLTSDKEEFSRGMDTIASEGLFNPDAHFDNSYKSWLAAFKMAEERLFIKEPGKMQRPRVILLITDPVAESLHVSLHTEERSLMEARKMRDRGIHMFALFYTNFEKTRRRLTAILGDGDNLQYVKPSEKKKSSDRPFIWLKDRITDVLCGRVQRCFFLNPLTKCQQDWYTPNLTTTQGDCTKIHRSTIPLTSEADKRDPTSLSHNETDMPCSLGDCKATCDDLWPTEIKCSESKCDKEFSRKGPARWKQLQNCGHTGKCPACRTTTSFPRPQSVPTSSQGPTTSCIEKNPPAFYYDDFDGAHRCAYADCWMILFACWVVMKGSSFLE